jgi:hypothetical protein
MKNTKMPWSLRILFSAGILMAVIVPFASNYVYIPDFFRGFSSGAGIGLMILYILAQKKYGNGRCRQAVSDSDH